MLQFDDKTLEKDIQKILTECGLPEFTDNDFLFIKEMIDEPKDIKTDVSKWTLDTFISFMLCGKI